MYKIIDSCYYFIGDIMENSLIEIINSIDTKDYKVFIERIKESLKSNNENNYYVGANNLNGAKISKTLSTRSEFLDKQEISMQSDLMDIRRQVVGNVDDAYIELMNRIKKSEFCDFEHLCYLVYEIVTDYFGYNYNLEKRLQIFKTIDEVQNTEISTIKGMNVAMCTERAMLSHNLLKFIGIDSTLKISSIKADNKTEIHAYNLIKNDDEYFIFDATLPKMENNSVTPLVTDISKDAYDLMKDGSYSSGASVKVIYQTPRRKNVFTMEYDSGRDFEELHDYASYLVK